MSVRVQTGNQLDVVIELRDEKKVVTGLQQWNGDFIPLRDPKALAEVLLAELKELK